MKRAVLIGDSIRQGYQPYVTIELVERVQIEAPQRNCMHSRRILERIDEWILNHPYDLVHLNCGLHDVAREPGNPPGKFVNTEIGEYQNNVRSILELIRARTKARIIWATSTPVILERQQATGGKDPHLVPEDVIRYNAAARSVVDELGIPVNDLYAVVAQAGPEKLLSADGVHFTQDGYKLLSQAVAQAIQNSL